MANPKNEVRISGKVKGKPSFEYVGEETAKLSFDLETESKRGNGDPRHDVYRTVMFGDAAVEAVGKIAAGTVVQVNGRLSMEGFRNIIRGRRLFVLPEGVEASLNRARIGGRLIGDAQVRYTEAGTPVAGVRLASNRYWLPDGVTSEEARDLIDRGEESPWREDSTFVNVTIWDDPHEAAAELLKAETFEFWGYLGTYQYETEDGEEREGVQITARGYKSIDLKKNSENEAAADMSVPMTEEDVPAWVTEDTEGAIERELVGAGA